MTKTRDRIFAGFGAALFILSACALTIAVVVSNLDKKNNPTTPADQAVVACDPTAPISATALPLPEVFKPEGAVKTLEKTELETGSGAVLKNGDCVQVKYFGTLAKNGMLFDENFDKPTGFQFQLGKGNVIPGWDQGLVGSRVGSTLRLLVPSKLAYGSQSNSSIPANSDLVFVVKILKVAK